MPRFPSLRAGEGFVLRRYFCGRHLFLKHHLRFIMFHPCLKVMGCKQQVYKDVDNLSLVFHGIRYLTRYPASHLLGKECFLIKK